MPPPSTTTTTVRDARPRLALTLRPPHPSSHLSCAVEGGGEYDEYELEAEMERRTHPHGQYHCAK